MIYYVLSAFLISTLVFMMNDLPLLTIEWLVCIALSTLIMSMVDYAFLREDPADF